MTDDNRDEQGEAVPLNWTCANCGYRVEGELPQECPECGADKEESLYRTQLFRCPRSP